MKKFIKIKLVFFLGMIISQNIYCQFMCLKTNTKFGIPIKNNNAIYVIYPNNYVFSKECVKKDNCSNFTPEETLISVFSSDNYEWEQSNYNYGIHKEVSKYKQKQQMNASENNFKLIRKLEFGIEDEEYAIIKYHIQEKTKLIPMSGVFKKIGIKWLLIIPENSITKLDLMFSYLSERALDAIFLNQKIGVSDFDLKIPSFYNQNVLNLTECMNYSPSDKMTENEMRNIIDELVINPLSSSRQVYGAVKFKNEDLNKNKVLISYVKEIENQKMFYYVDESYSNAVLDDELKNYENINLTEKDQPILKFNFNYDTNDYSILKYKNISGDTIIKSFFKSGINWKISQKNKIIDIMNNIIVNKNIDYFKMIFSIKNDKLNFTDKNGILNIFLNFN
jgi:hypothetical protein